MPKSDKLTTKQKKFADKYLECGNATESAVYAGYSQKTAYKIGSENLIKPQVQNYIAHNQEKTAKKLQLSREDMIQKFLEIHSLALTPQGDNGRLDLTAGNNSLDKISKMLGLYEAQKLDITSGGNVIPTIINTPGKAVDTDSSDS